MSNSYEDIVRQAVAGGSGTAANTSLETALAGWDDRALRLSDAYARRERAAARDLAAEIGAAYDAAVTSAQENAAARRQELDAQLRADIGVNAVEELVSRRQLEERLANMGLLQSGYGATNQVAVSLQKTNADASARARRAAGVAEILRETAAVERESGANQAKAKGEALYDAEKRVGDYVAALGQQAGNAALSQYKTDADAGAAADAAGQKQRNYLTDLSMEAAQAAQKDAQSAAEHNLAVLKLAASVEDAALRARVLRELR